MGVVCGASCEGRRRRGRGEEGVGKRMLGRGCWEKEGYIEYIDLLILFIISGSHMKAATDAINKLVDESIGKYPSFNM